MTSLPGTVPLSDGEDRRRKHVAIVGINYAPEQSGIAPYTTAVAERLAATGYKVTAVTGMPHYPQWRIVPPYRGRSFVEEDSNGVRVLRFASYVPRRQSALTRALYEASFLLSAGRAVWSLARPDVIVAVVPALTDAVLARFFAARLGIPYGIIFQDIMGRSAAQSGIAGGSQVAAATRWLEGWSARGAGAVATVSERFIPYLVGLGVRRERIMHLPNWNHVAAPTADRSTTRARFGWSEGDVIVLHAGNMGLKQGLQQLLAAAALAQRRNSAIRFAFIGDGNQRELLQREAAHLPNVEFHAFQPESAFPDVLAAADVLLVSERASAIDMSLPSKLTSYFSAGRPIVAAVPPGGATAHEVKRSGGGLVVPAGRPQALLGAVLRLQEDEVLTHRLCQAAQEYAAHSLSAKSGLLRAEQFITRLEGETGCPSLKSEES